MNAQEALKEEEAIEKEVMKRWKALGEIISVKHLRDELLAGMFKAGAMVGGGSFLLGLLFIYAEGRYDDFPLLVAGSLVVFIVCAFVYASGATTAFESALEREIRRRLREWG